MILLSFLAYVGMAFTKYQSFFQTMRFIAPSEQAELKKYIPINFIATCHDDEYCGDGFLLYIQWLIMRYPLYKKTLLQSIAHVNGGIFEHVCVANCLFPANNAIDLQIEALQQLLIQTQKQGEQEISSAIAELDNKIKTLKQQQRDLTAELAQYVQDSLPETADSAAYLEAAADSVFIPADASEDVEAMDKIRRARQLERRNQAISAFETLAILRQELEPLAEEAAEMKAAASAADSASGNIGLNTAIKTSVIKSFFNYAKQQATVLKRETAREYAASVAYKRAEPDRDISTFNLDDYKFELPEGVKGCADVNK